MCRFQLNKMSSAWTESLQNAEIGVATGNIDVHVCAWRLEHRPGGLCYFGLFVQTLTIHISEK
jgi:hypothetical protein